MDEIVRRLLLRLPGQYHCGIKTTEEHREHLRKLFQSLEQFGMASIPLNVFWERLKTFLGHFISGKGLTPLPQKVKAIVNFPESQNVKGLRRVLGMINFYHRFLPNIVNT